MKKTALPVTDVAFPTITICASGFHMTNVEKAVSDNFGRYSELLYPNTKYLIPNTIHIILSTKSKYQISLVMLEVARGE